jgi:hypothetical protein
MIVIKIINKQATGKVKRLNWAVRSMIRQTECRLKKSDWLLWNLYTISSWIGFRIDHLASNVPVASIRVRMPVIHEKSRREGCRLLMGIAGNVRLIDEVFCLWR